MHIPYCMCVRVFLVHSSRGRTRWASDWCPPCTLTKGSKRSFGIDTRTWCLKLRPDCVGNLHTNGIGMDMVLLRHSPHQWHRNGHGTSACLLFFIFFFLTSHWQLFMIERLVNLKKKGYQFNHDTKTPWQHTHFRLVRAFNQLHVVWFWQESQGVQLFTSDIVVHYFSTDSGYISTTETLKIPPLEQALDLQYWRWDQEMKISLKLGNSKCGNDWAAAAPDKSMIHNGILPNATTTRYHVKTIRINWNRVLCKLVVSES